MRSVSSSQVALLEDWQHGGFGLYIHWPFCQAKCPYCDFNSHVSSQIDQTRWLAAYLSELDRVAALTGPRILDSVFFGGGTPSLMAPETVAGILERVRKNWRLSNSLEVTLEANPTSVEAGKFRGFRDAGVNRISMGVQALNDADLKALGRLHSVAEARTAFDIARTTFDRVSFDLIYARQDQTLSDWRSELTAALDMAIDHLSLYQLTIEDGTAFGMRHAAGRLTGLPSEDLAADMYEVTQEVSAAAGMPAYEVSNHARPGEESRHNLIYWRYGDYAGIGPGAHGRLTLNGMRTATYAPAAPGAWLHAVESAGTGQSESDALTAEDQFTEFALMGLRLNEGVRADRFSALSGGSCDANLADLVDLGLLEVTPERIRATPKGRPMLNAVLSKLLGG